MIISFMVIIGAVAYILIMYSADEPISAEEEVSEAETIRAEYTGDIEQYNDVIKKVSSFTDYGEPDLDNVGRENPFAPLN